MTSAIEMPLTMAAALASLAAESLAAQELAEASLDRIARYDGVVSSFIHVDRRATASPGPLCGIPIGIKDIFDVAEMPASGNSRVFLGRVPQQDAAAVASLRHAGATLLGKTAAWECAMGGTSFTLPWPPARNPWDLSHDPGGSSTGSAAALAAGFCLGALGSDTGGSIREPASWCGLAGLKPTYGLVSTAGAMAASFSLDHVGPMARTSLDCALLLDALTGQNTADEIADGIAGLRIGVVDLDGEDELHLASATADALSRTVRLLATQGATVSRVRLPPLRRFSAVCTLLAAVEGFVLHRDTIAASPDLYDPLTLERLLVGRSIAGIDYVAADCVRADVIADVLAAMADVDLLLMPTTRDTAPLLGGFDSHGGHPSLCRPWNVTGFPALSVRTGFASSGLPLAVQVIGRPGLDGLVLRVGHAIEKRQPDKDLWPAIADLAPTTTPMAGPHGGSGLETAVQQAIIDVRSALRPSSVPAGRFSINWWR